MDRLDFSLYQEQARRTQNKSFANIAKLRNRYPHEFSAEQSINRVEYKAKKIPVRSKYYSTTRKEGGAQ